jgi:hypothetical protein
LPTRAFPLLCYAPSCRTVCSSSFFFGMFFEIEKTGSRFTVDEALRGQSDAELRRYYVQPMVLKFVPQTEK